MLPSFIIAMFWGQISTPHQRDDNMLCQFYHGDPANSVVNFENLKVPSKINNDVKDIISTTFRIALITCKVVHK